MERKIEKERETGRGIAKEREREKRRKVGERECER